MAKHYPSGMFPADTAPTTVGKAPKGPDNLPDRLENMGIPKTTAQTRMAAAEYLSQYDDAELLAEYLGLLPELQAMDAAT